MSISIDSMLASLEKTAQIEKTASDKTDVKPAISADLANVLEKKASDDLTKQAFAEGEALARDLLAKMANEIQADNAAMVADDDKKILPNATGGDIEGVLQGTVDNALATGATTDDRVNHETTVNNVVPAGGAIGTEKQAADASAQTNENKEDTTMNKQASNTDLAKLIMEKLAQEFSDVVTTPAAAVNVAGAPVPNKIQQDNAVMTAHDDAKSVGVGDPGGDGTINALFEKIVARAKAEGGQSDDLINGPGHVEASPIFTDAVEKAAAVSELCGQGMDFETAVSLVKQAEEAIFADAWEIEKKAAFDQLMEQGIDFDQAIALIKQAEEDLIAEAKAE